MPLTHTTLPRCCLRQGGRTKEWLNTGGHVASAVTCLSPSSHLFTKPGQALMNEQEVRAVIGDVARDILADIAPQELPIFPAVCSAYFADPSAAMRRQHKREAALGFDTEALSPLLGPAVLFVLTQVVEIVGGTIKKIATDELAKGGTAMVKGIFKKFRPPGGQTAPLPLAEAQRSLIQQKITSIGQDLKLPEEKVAQLAKAITAQLAITE